MKPSELKAIRERLGISQEELAASLGVHRVSVARWEAGMRKIPSMLTLAIKALESERRKGRK
jgi:repressor LexA